MKIAKKIIFFFLIFVLAVYFLPYAWPEIQSWTEKEADNLPARIDYLERLF
ncbi:MAG: hypothetical protein AB1721_02510 [Patescibacteria group bacterium]